MFLVTIDATRPAGRKDRCFYCNQLIGTYHENDCVLIMKKAKIRMIIEYEIDVPASWNKDLIEFHRNGSSWCASNAIDELQRLFGDTCMCDSASFECVSETESEQYLEE